LEPNEKTRSIDQSSVTYEHFSVRLWGNAKFCQEPPITVQAIQTLSAQHKHSTNPMGKRTLITSMTAFPWNLSKQQKLLQSGLH